MKAKKIGYWITTGLFSLMMVFSAYSYLTSEEMKGFFVHLGFPDSFRVELAVAKFIGVAVLILPFFKGRIKEWAYAGFVITLISGFIAHFSAGDDVSRWAPALVALVILLSSYFLYHSIQKTDNK